MEEYTCLYVEDGMMMMNVINDMWTLDISNVKWMKVSRLCLYTLDMIMYIDIMPHLLIINPHPLIIVSEYMFCTVYNCIHSNIQYLATPTN